MFRLIRRVSPLAALCLALSLTGCVVYPGGGYYNRGGWGPGWHQGWHEHDGWRGRDWR